VSRIVLAAGASAALHKACDLASKLSSQGHQVRTVLTVRATSLVSGHLFEALTGEPAFGDEFGAERRGSMDHIDLAQWAEVFVVAPCTADLASRFALGLADELVGTVALALPPEVPRLLCPAMNSRMLEAPPIVRNLAQLREDGWRILEPGEGHLACGDEGKGRMSEVPEILAAVAELLG
jgi:phosphopantothenoylcysteine decarboxylase / phosphopantothenate---cysteine ligase